MIYRFTKFYSVFLTFVFQLLIVHVICWNPQLGGAANRLNDRSFVQLPPDPVLVNKARLSKSHGGENTSMEMGLA